MREIKFQGKCIESKDWKFGWLARIQEDDGSYLYIIKEDTTRHIANVTQTSFQVDPETVGQYTGLKDKNGKEIYEGDIIHSKASDGFDVYHLVVFENGAFRGKSKVFNGGWDYDCGRIDQKWLTEFEKEIIGNQFSNPELLK